MDTLNAFASSNAQAMEDWLAGRYVELYGSDPERQYEAGRLDAYGVYRTESFLDGLKLLFDKLPIGAKPRFRQAVGALLRHAQPGEFPARAMNELVLLVGLTGAHDQVVAFEPVLGSGAWGESTPELFFCALAVLRGLKQGDASYQAQKRLLTCRHFPNEYIFDAYEILIGAHPERWHLELQELAPGMLERERRLRELRDPQALTDLALRYEDLVEELLESVSLERIAEGLRVLMQHTLQLTTQHPVGRVIAVLASGGPAGGVEIDAGSGDFRVRRAQAPLAVPLRGLSPAGDLFLERLLARSKTTAVPAAPARQQREGEDPRIEEAVRQLRQSISPPLREREAVYG